MQVVLGLASVQYPEAVYSPSVLLTVLATCLYVSATTKPAIGLPSAEPSRLTDSLTQAPPAPPVNPRPNPNEERFLQPLPTPLPTTPEQERPVLPTPTPIPTSPEAPPVRFPVRKIEVSGNTIFRQEIQRLTAAFEGREVTLEELRSLADAITQLYIDQGYITSRAVLPDQAIADGVIQIRMIEGSLEAIQLEGTQRLNPSYIRDRIRLAARTPLNSAQLEDQLRLLRTNPLFQNVEASLRAGTGLGQSILVVRVAEANPFRATLSFDNFSPPSIGSERFGVNLSYRNITGLGDEFFASYYRTVSGGSNILDFIYRIPVNAREGTLQLRAAPNWFKVTEGDFEELEIEGNSQLYEASFRQPLIRSPREEFALTVGFTYRDGQTFLGDEPFGFGLGPEEDGTTRTRVFKFEQDYVRRDPQGATAVRSQFSLGTGLLNATINPNPIPDARFFSWLGQIQRVQRLNNDHLLIVQADIQLSPNALLSSQQFVIGGGQSLRGYRQNVRAGDNGFRFSVEDRFTIQRNEAGLPVMQLAPFFDMGTVWNQSDNPNDLPDQRFLAGIGLGFLWQPLPRLNLRLDYGYPLIDLDERGNNLQDAGFYFQLLYQPF